MVKRNISFNRAVVLIGALLATAASAVLMIRAGSASVSRIPDARSEALSPEPGGPLGAAAPIIRIWVHPDEIYPDVVNITPGQAVLMAENARTDNISLVVERLVQGQSNQSVASISVSNIAKRAGVVLNLIAGEYIFYEQSRPDLTGLLKVDTN